MSQSSLQIRANDASSQFSQTAPTISNAARGLGAHITGIDLNRLDDDAFAEIKRAFLEHHVLIFHDQDLTPGSQVAFARRFGEVQVHVMNQYHDGEHPELYTLSNLDAHGRPNGQHPDKGTLVWHTDGSWMKRTGLATLMRAVEVPEEGGETHFCDMHGAYDRLSMQRRAALAGLKAIHNLDFSRQRRHGEDPMTDEQRRQVPPVAHPIIRTHPETGQQAIFLGDHAETIEGMSYEAGRTFVDELNAEIIHDDLIYKHRWQPGHVVIWDNRSVLHRATPYDTANARRVIRRCTVLGDTPFFRA